MDVSLRALAHDLEECLTRTLGPDMRHCFRAWSYLDDLIVGVPPAVVQEALELTASHLDVSGYLINWKKLELYSLTPPPPPTSFGPAVGHRATQLTCRPKGPQKA